MAHRKTAQALLGRIAPVAAAWTTGLTPTIRNVAPGAVHLRTGACRQNPWATLERPVAALLLARLTRVVSLRSDLLRVSMAGLADSIATAKFILLVNYRPEYSHQWNGKTYYTQLRLDPLGKESAEEMLSALVGDGKDLIPLKRLIIERTEGTPFFMEEIIQTLSEDGVLQRNGAVKLVRSMNAVKVPATVQAVLVLLEPQLAFVQL